VASVAALSSLRILAVAGCCSILLRILAVAVSGPLPGGDPQIYLQLAQHIAGGEGLHRFSPTLGVEVLALHPPLYPLVLAPFIPHVALANFLIDLACAAAMLWLARTCRVSGEFAAALWLIASVWLSAIPHKEGLVAALAVASAAAAIEKRAVLLGAFGALLALTQPGIAPLPALFAVTFMSPRSLPVVAATGIAVMLPWWTRNWIELGAFVPLTSSSGYSFWIGALSDHRWAPLPAHLLVGSELGISNAAAGEAWQWVSAHPVAYIAGSLSKAILLAAPLMVVTAMSKGTVRTVLALALINLFAFQMWFELGARHLVHVLPVALIALATTFPGREEKLQ
jgi:hypothetical protein